MKKYMIFLSAVIITTAFIILNFTLAVSADDFKVNSIVLLGDSITYGFGLSEDEQNYGDILGEYYGAEVQNFAQNGLTTDGLLEKLEQEEIQSAVKDCGMVCLSIGGNDLLHIFLEAFSEVGMDFQTDTRYDSEISTADVSSEFYSNFSSEFVQKFIMDYASQFAPAASKAAENIKTISQQLHDLNPNAVLVMQTVYQPFESSDENKNTIMKPLGTFTGMQLTPINESVKENAPYTADILTKFSEKPYLYTNIDKMDIHPNALGHMLIAEEIAQTVGISGDSTVFKNIIDNIPHGTFSEMPSYMMNELDDFAKGEFRRGTLEQYKERQTNAEVTTEEVTETEEQQTTEVSAEEKEAETKLSKTEEKSSIKGTLAKIFMILGLSIILAVTTYKFIKKRKNRK